MATNRATIISHPKVANVQYHVTNHQKYERVKPGGSDEATLVPAGEPFPVIELFERDESGELNLISRCRLDAFTELSRDVVKTAREMLPKSDADEPSEPD